MDPITLLDTYNSNPPQQEEEQKKQVTRDIKDEAFYGSMVLSGKQDAMGTYEQVLEDISRFGESPLLDQLKTEYNTRRQEQVQNKANEILADQTLPAPQKLQLLKAVTAEPEGKTPAKSLYIEVIGGTKPEEAPPIRRKIPGKIIRPNSHAANKLAEQQESFLDKAEQFAVDVLGRSGIAKHMALGAKAAFDFLDEANKQSAWETTKDVAEVGATTATGLGAFIASGYAGIWKVAGGNREAADKAMASIYDAVYKGDGEAYLAGMDALDNLGQLVDIPFQALADYGWEKTLELTGNEDLSAATGTGLYLAPASLILAPGAYMYRKGMRQVKEDLIKEAKLHERVESIFTLDPESPIGQTEQHNREAAADLAAGAIKADNPTFVDALGTTKPDLIATTVLPKLDENLQEIYPNAYEKLKQLDKDFLEHMKLDKVDPYLYDPAAIAKDIDTHMEIAYRQTNLYPMHSSSYIEDTGTSMRGHIIYGKGDNKGWTDDNDLFGALMQLEGRIAKDLGVKRSAVKLSPIEDPVSGEKYLKWDFFNIYDPKANTALTTGTLQAKFGPFDVSEWANSSFGKLIYSPANRLTEWITYGPGLATARATNFTKNWSAAIRDNILSIQNQRDLLDAIIRTEEKGEYLTPQMIDEIYPKMLPKQKEEFNLAYATFRRLDEHLYYITNETYRNTKIAAGNHGLYTLDGKYTNHIGSLVKTDADGNVDITGMDGAKASEVFDFTQVQKVDPLTGDKYKQPTGPRPLKADETKTLEVYRLDKPIAIAGKTYEFATGIQGGRVPERLLPHIPGHYPHLNDEPYFIKAVPKELYINGNKIERKADGSTEELFAQAATTMHVARGQKAGEKWARELQKENPDYEYIVVSDRKTQDDNLGLHFDTVKYAQDWARSRKKERLTTPDGQLGRLEDPVVSMYNALQQASRFYTHKDFDREFRRNWVNSYGAFTGGKFPENVTQINIHPNMKSKDNLVMLNAAKESFEQYARQSHTKETIFDPLWQAGTLKTARLLEEVSPTASDVLLKLHNKREPIFSTALKAAFIRAISLNPLKQYIIQPAQLNEFAAMAASRGDFKFAGELALFGTQMFKDLVLKNAAFKRVIPGAEKLISDSPEYNKILKAFENSGIPSAINMHAVVDGVWIDAKSPLSKSTTEMVGRRALGSVKAVAHAPRALGFDKAELINQIGMWLYARHEFIRLNPGKKWDDPHNLAQINAKAIGAGNFMLTRGDILPYQEGTFRFLMQFAAFGNKAVLQPFNSKILTTDEKVRMAAIRFMMYGKRGILGGEILDKAITGVQDAYASAEPQDVEKKTILDETMELYRRGGMDLLVNSFLRAMFDDPDPAAPKTDLAPSKVMSPTPESTVPMLDLVWSIMELAKEEKDISQAFPFISGASSLYDTVNTMFDVFHVRKNEPQTEDEAKKYFKQLAEWGVGWSNFEKALAMQHTGNLVDKFGNSLEIGASRTEAFAKAWGIPSIKESLYYDITTNRAKMAKEIKSSAERIVKDLDFVMSTYGTETDIMEFKYQMDSRINSLVGLYDQAGLGDEIRSEVLAQLKKQASKGISTSVMALLEQNASTYKGYRRSIAERMNLLKETSGEKTATMLEKIYGELEETSNGQ